MLCTQHRERRAALAHLPPITNRIQRRTAIAVTRCPASTLALLAALLHFAACQPEGAPSQPPRTPALSERPQPTPAAPNQADPTQANPTPADRRDASAAPTRDATSPDPALALRADGVEVRDDELAARIAWESLERGVPVARLAERELRGIAERALHSALRERDLREWAALPDGASVEHALVASAWARATSDDPRRRAVPIELARRYASQSAREAAWLQARVARTTEDDRYFAWRTLNDQLVALVATVPNDPEDSAVGSLYQREPERIERWYAERIHRYQQPARARVSVVYRTVPEAERSERHPERARLEAARERLLAGEDFAAIAAEVSDHPSAARGGAFGEVQGRRMPPVFELQTGELTEVLEDRRGYYIARLDAQLPPSPMPLDDALRRRIAREIVRETLPQARPLEAARAIQAALRDGDLDAARTLAAEAGVALHETPAFRRSPHDHVPFAGQSAPLHERIFQPDVGDDFSLSEPILGTLGVVALRVLSRTSTSRERFERVRDDFEPEFRTLMERESWPARLVEVGAPGAALRRPGVESALRRLDLPPPPSRDDPPHLRPR